MSTDGRRDDAERLAVLRKWFAGCHENTIATGPLAFMVRMCDERDAIIAAKDAELAALRADFDNAMTTLTNVLPFADRQLEALRAENERLREAAKAYLDESIRDRAKVGYEAVLAERLLIALTPPQEPQG